MINDAIDVAMDDEDDMYREMVGIVVSGRGIKMRFLVVNFCEFFVK